MIVVKADCLVKLCVLVGNANFRTLDDENNISYLRYTSRVVVVVVEFYDTENVRRLCCLPLHCGVKVRISGGAFR